METWLHVAEKPSVARELTHLLAGSHFRSSRTCARFNPLLEFDYSLSGSSASGSREEGRRNQKIHMLVTSVAGHMMETDFDAATKAQGWKKLPVVELFARPLQKSVKRDAEDVARHLTQVATKATVLVCWLDCDREGENIAFEVVEVCTRANPRLRIKRAKFSSLRKTEIVYALNHLVEPDVRLSDAAQARSEIDLRIGAAFTRFQTLKLRERFEGLPDLVSYGPCQFPTLGFIVHRHHERESFVEEAFWKIAFEFQNVEFRWSRGVLFDEMAVNLFYVLSVLDSSAEQPGRDSARTLTSDASTEDIEILLSHVSAEVTQVHPKTTRKLRPVPLATVELQKLASRHLHMNSTRCMALAESLYQEGFISYPRTETDSFSASNEELRDFIQVQTPSSNPWGAYAQRLLQSTYTRPRAGSHDDKAHPPIHPLKSLARDDTNDEKYKFYELIARHFLAVCSPDAIGAETLLHVKLGEERFSARGLCVQEAHWLEVFRYAKWQDRTLPPLALGDRFKPDRFEVVAGKTTPPNLLSEVDLISLMDAHGIGTDATIATHIQTIQDRNYVNREPTGLFVPTQLGLALTNAYTSLELNDLLLPYIRSNMEADLALIAAGRKSKTEVIQAAVAQYKEIFLYVQSHANILVRSVSHYFPSKTVTGMRELLTLGLCGSCQRTPVVVFETREPRVERVGWCKTCALRLPLPPHGLFRPSNHICPLCQFPVIQVTNTEKNTSHYLCTYCFANPPDEFLNSSPHADTMRCFQCPAATKCALAPRAASVVRSCEYCEGGKVTLSASPPNQGNQNALSTPTLRCSQCAYFVMLPQGWEISVIEPAVRCRRCQQSQHVRVDFVQHGGRPPMGLEPVVELCLWCTPEIAPYLSFQRRGKVQRHGINGNQTNTGQEVAREGFHTISRAAPQTPTINSMGRENSRASHTDARINHYEGRNTEIGGQNFTSGEHGSSPTTTTETSTRRPKRARKETAAKPKPKSEKKTSKKSRDVCCECERPATRFVSKQTGTAGRAFYACARRMGDPSRCTFFKWEDG